MAWQPGVITLHCEASIAIVQEVPCARQGHTAVWDFSDSLIVFGGLSESSVLNDVFVLSLSSGFWTRKECVGHAPSVRYGHSAVMIACNLMLVFGGCSAQVGLLIACPCTSCEWRAPGCYTLSTRTDPVSGVERGIAGASCNAVRDLACPVRSVCESRKTAPASCPMRVLCPMD